MSGHNFLFLFFFFPMQKAKVTIVTDCQTDVWFICKLDKEAVYYRETCELENIENARKDHGIDMCTKMPRKDIVKMTMVDSKETTEVTRTQEEFIVESNDKIVAEMIVAWIIDTQPYWKKTKEFARETCDKYSIYLSK